MSSEPEDFQKDEATSRHFQALSLEIEAVCDRGPVRMWSQRDFIFLHEDILEKTGENISVTTLKRILGKVEYKSLPYIHTLNILARYCGHSHWEDFRLKKAGMEIRERLPSPDSGNPVLPQVPFYPEPSREEDFHKGQVHPSSSRIRWILGSALLFFLLGGITGIWFERRNNVSGPLPANLNSPGKLSYRIFNPDTLPADLLFQYQGPVPKKGDLTVISLLPGKMQYFHINEDGYGEIPFRYEEPGVYFAKIFSNQTQLAYTPVLIQSKGWILSSRFQGKSRNHAVQYFPNGQFPLNTKLLQRQGVDTLQRFFTQFRTFQNFEMDGDSIDFQTEVRLKQNGAKVKDQLITLKIRGGNFPLAFQFARWVPRAGFFLQIGNKTYETHQRRALRQFVHSFDDWTKIRISVRARHVEVWVDDRKIFKDAYDLPMGEVLGLEYDFAGCGEIRQVKLSDGKGRNWEEFLGTVSR